MYDAAAADATAAVAAGYFCSVTASVMLLHLGFYISGAIVSILMYSS